MTLLKEMKTHFGLKYVIDTNDRIYGINATGSKDHYYSRNTRAEILGYKPTKTSLDCVLQETEVILSMTHAN